MVKILVYLEYRNQIIQPSGLQVLAKAYEISQELRCEIHGIVIGRDSPAAMNQLKGLPLKNLYVYESQEFFFPDIYESLVVKCVKELCPSILLFGGTKEGKTLASRSAAALRTGVTVDCTDVYVRGKDSLVQVRPAYGGNVIAEIVTETSRPQIAVLSDNLMVPLQGMNWPDAKIICCREFANLESPAKLIECCPRVEEKGISDRDVIIAVGRGIKRQEDIGLLETLACRLGGALASTRGLVERSWMPHSTQVGLSGHAVRVKLLITFGVSGTVQFMAGIRRADYIIAVNTDEHAPIFSYADYCFHGDYEEIVPLLLKKLPAKG